ncbi:unnamed protein product [Durusdinium trenchii]|uniref:Uncharacterized protein n=1 Tax=Durusdinium trenchii TaxID=1381693 RepID=A0ABP0KUI6_9DINO
MSWENPKRTLIEEAIVAPFSDLLFCRVVLKWLGHAGLLRRARSWRWFGARIVSTSTGVAFPAAGSGIFEGDACCFVELSDWEGHSCRQSLEKIIDPPKTIGFVEIGEGSGVWSPQHGQTGPESLLA